MPTTIFPTTVQLSTNVSTSVLWGRLCSSSVHQILQLRARQAISFTATAADATASAIADERRLLRQTVCAVSSSSVFAVRKELLPDLQWVLVSTAKKTNTLLSFSDESVSELFLLFSFSFLHRLIFQKFSKRINNRFFQHFC